MNTLFHSFFMFCQRMSTVVMQSLAYVQHSSSVPGARLFISGDLRLQQRTPLPHRGLYNIYNVRLLQLSLYTPALFLPLHKHKERKNGEAGVVVVVSKQYSLSTVEHRNYAEHSFTCSFNKILLTVWVYLERRRCNSG